MSNYATVSDIESRLNTRGITFDGSTNPTSTEISDLIEQVESEINSVLIGQGYETVPVTGTRDIKMLRRYAADKVAAEAIKIIFSGSQLPDWVKSWLDDYAAFLNRLRQGQQRLLDQDPALSKSGFLTVSTATFRSQRWVESDLDTYEEDMDPQ